MAVRGHLGGTRPQCVVNCNPVELMPGAEYSGQPRWKSQLRDLRIVDDHVRAGGDLQDCRVHLICTRPDDVKAGPTTHCRLPGGRNGPWAAIWVVLQRRPPALYLVYEPSHLWPERRERIVCTSDQPLFLGVQQLAAFLNVPGTRTR